MDHQGRICEVLLVAVARVQDRQDLTVVVCRFILCRACLVDEVEDEVSPGKL